MKTLGNMIITSSNLGKSLHKSRNVIALCTLFLFLWSEIASAQVKSFVTQPSYYQGDPITLVIETDQSSSANPDLSPLEKDFQVKGTSTSSRINFINGSRSFSKTWRIQLQAKKSGKLTIPSISLGSDKTRVLEFSVNVLPPEVAAETKKHIFIESTLDNDQKEIYVQQQVPYTVKFFYDAAMQTGEVILPSIENLNLRVLGKEKKYETTREGRKFVVVERRYVVSPEKSGELIIPPTVVQGRIAITNGDSEQLRKRMDETDMLNELFFDLNSGSRFNPFDPFFSRRSIGPTRPYTVSSEPIKLNILPVPTEFTGSAWMPTEEIKMQDSWAKKPPILKVGEPVSRTIVMQVKGLANSQIPEIEIPTPEGIKVYQEPSKGQSPNDGNTIYGLQQTDVSYIPSKAGEVIIPEIKIDWWDVKSKQQRTYILPKWRLNVEEGDVTIAEESKANELNEQTRVSPNESQHDKTNEIEASEQKKTHIEKGITWLKQNRVKASSLVLLTFVTIWFLFAYKKQYKQSDRYIKSQQAKATKMRATKVKKGLLEACKDNEKHTVEILLIEYVALLNEEHNIKNLGALIENVEKDDGTIIKELEQSIYAAITTPWDGTRLQQLILSGFQFKVSVKNKNDTNGLAPLYPH